MAMGQWPLWMPVGASTVGWGCGKGAGLLALACVAMSWEGLAGGCSEQPSVAGVKLSSASSVSSGATKTIPNRATVKRGVHLLEVWGRP